MSVKELEVDSVHQNVQERIKVIQKRNTDVQYVVKNFGGMNLSVEKSNSVLLSVWLSGVQKHLLEKEILRMVTKDQTSLNLIKEQNQNLCAIEIPCKLRKVRKRLAEINIGIGKVENHQQFGWRETEEKEEDFIGDGETMSLGEIITPVNCVVQKTISNQHTSFLFQSQSNYDSKLVMGEPCV